LVVVSINRTETSISRSTQLDYAIPASRSLLVIGELLYDADDPHEKIKLKMFNAEL
jgi:hypothetical protein